VICGISSLIQSPFDCCIMLAEGQVRSICSSCFHWKHSRFLSETFLHDTRNNRDNRVSPLTTDHPQRASNVTRAKSSGSLSLSLSLSLSRALSLSCVHRGAFTLITHLGFMAPGMHTRMFARIIGRAVRCAPVPWEQSSCTRERERERERESLEIQSTISATRTADHTDKDRRDGDSRVSGQNCWRSSRDAIRTFVVTSTTLEDR